MNTINTFAHVLGTEQLTPLPVVSLSKCIGGSLPTLKRILVSLEQPVVLLPHYSAVGDTQSCVTGKVKEGESPEDASVRELAEEMGLYVDPSNLQPVGREILDERSSLKTIDYFILDISACVHPSSEQGRSIRVSCNQRGEWNDIKNHKVCIFVTCNYNPAALQAIVTRNRLPTGVTGDSAGETIVIMPTSELIRLVNQIKGIV